jgi:hypothetical protein
VSNAELWCNLGLCCFYSNQYDTCLPCFQRALEVADDSAAPDVWYNIGQVIVRGRGEGVEGKGRKGVTEAKIVCLYHIIKYNIIMI